MNKSKLIEMGLTDEQAAQVLGELDGSYIPKTRFNEVNTELKQAKDTLKERDTQLETLKIATGNEEALKQQITDLQETNRMQAEAHDTAIRQLKIDTAVDVALINAKAKNTRAVKALLELDGIELDDNGSIKGLDDTIKRLKESDDSKFLFEETVPPKFIGIKPGESRQGIPGDTDLKQASYAELCEYLSQNPETKLS